VLGREQLVSLLLGYRSPIIIDVVQLVLMVLVVLTQLWLDHEIVIFGETGLLYNRLSAVID